MAEPVTPHQAEQSDVSFACIAQGPILASIESFTPPSQQEPEGVVNMSPEKLKNFIFEENTTIPVSTALVTLSGLPSCGKLKTTMLLELLHKYVHTQLKDLEEVAEVTEAKFNEKFSFFELAAVEDKWMPANEWHWYPFTKRSGYLSCFVSALEKQKARGPDQGPDQGKPDQGKPFPTQLYKQCIFDNKVLDSCFHGLYRLLSSLYNDKSETPIPLHKLTGGADLFLVNVWDIGLNRAVLHFLTVLAGYLHHNFPILALSLTNDAWCLQSHIDTKGSEVKDDERKSKDLEPILRQYSRVSFLLQFSRLGRSMVQEREKVCEIVAIVNPDNKPAREEYPAISEWLQNRISETAECLGVTSLLHGSPWIIDPNDPDDLKLLKENVDKLVAKEKQESGLPLSWIFLRSAFFKTGQLYIKTDKLKECAKKCKITDENFKKFLREFTGFGSIIHIPDIPVLCDYVILNPVDFFHKLSELFYPRFNGDLRNGIASRSTLRRMFGGDLQFFWNVLTACTFAVEIDSNRIEDAKTKRGLLIAEKCLYIPGIRTGELSTDDSIPKPYSLLLVYNKAMHPTHITVNAVKFLVDEVPNLTLLTCECYTVTKFQYSGSKPTVSLKMISHRDKNEIRIENDEEDATDIKEQVIKAYHYAIENYKQKHLQLLKSYPDLEFALACPNNPMEQYHYVCACGQPACKFCKEDDTFLKLQKLWKGLLEEVM